MSQFHERRTVRKFAQTPVSRELLMECVEAARVAPSGANLQPLEYKLLCTPEDCARLFPLLQWAGYLEHGAPGEGERPTAYIVAVQNTDKRAQGVQYDAGAAIMCILLRAHELGLGSCWIGSVDRAAAERLFGFPENRRVLCVAALGYPAQRAVLEPMRGSVRYWLDAEGVLHVPKRSMEDILL